MAFNPNAVFISPSSLGDYDKCPQRYYYNHVYRTPRGMKIQLINPALALGQAVHDTLEMYLRMPPVERAKEILDNKFDFAWGNVTGEKGGFTSKDEEEQYKQRAVSMLSRFWGNQHFREAEKAILPSFPKAELGNDLILTGKLDWVEKEGDGYHFVDFKTGKEEREDSMQLPIYAVLLEHIYKNVALQASYWYLDLSDELTNYELPDLKEILATMKQKGEIIKMARETNSFRCQSGLEECWACKEIKAVAEGKGKLVSIDPSRKQEVYIIIKEGVGSEGVGQGDEKVITEPDTQSDLPF